MYTIEEFDQTKMKVLKYVLYKKRSENEIRKKFENSIENDLLEDIIEYLKEAKYINDKDYIDKTIKNFMALKNLSIKEIEYKLYSKGINKKDIEDYVSENNEELIRYEIKSAQNIVNKKNTIMEKQEIKQYLMKKGYKVDSIEEALAEY